MLTPTPELMTAREKILLDMDLAENEKNRKHALDLKRLDVEAKKLELRLRQEERAKSQRHQARMQTLQADQARYEANWTAVLKIPLTLIKLPVYILFGVAYCIMVIVKVEPPTEFWKTLK
jgi:hypothetical protein